MVLNLRINGEHRTLVGPVRLDGLLAQLGFDSAKIAVERNAEIVPRSTYATVELGEGDRLEIVHFIGGGNAPTVELPPDKPLVIAGTTYNSRLIVGTGKYKTYAENAAAVEAAGAEIVTVALRRVNLSDPSAPRLVDFIDPMKITYLPNT